jgi:hypothetical protein
LEKKLRQRVDKLRQRKPPFTNRHP